VLVSLGIVSVLHIGPIVWRWGIDLGVSVGIPGMESRRDGARGVGLATVLVLDALGAQQVLRATGCLAAFCAAGLALGLRVLTVAALVGLLGAVAGGGFDAFTERFFGEAPHETLARLLTGLVDLLECLHESVESSVTGKC
jgi:hypothetical protein